MTAEEIIKVTIGDLVMRNAVLTAKLEEAQKELVALGEAHAKTDHKASE